MATQIQPGVIEYGPHSLGMCWEMLDGFIVRERIPDGSTLVHVRDRLGEILGLPDDKATRERVIEDLLAKKRLYLKKIEALEEELEGRETAPGVVCGVCLDRGEVCAECGAATMEGEDSCGMCGNRGIDPCPACATTDGESKTAGPAAGDEMAENALGCSDTCPYFETCETRNGPWVPAVSKPAGVEDGSYLRACKAFLENEILPRTIAGRFGVDSKFYIPPRLIDDYRKVLDIAAKREKGNIRMIGVLQRYCKKIRELQETIRAVKAKERELFNCLTTD